MGKKKTNHKEQHHIKYNKRNVGKISSIANYGNLIEFFEFNMRLDNVITHKIKKNEFEKIVNDITCMHTFVYYTPIDNVFDFPIGLKIGNCEVVSYQNIPTSNDGFVKIFHKRYSKQSKQILFLKTEIKTIGGTNASDRAKDILKDTIHILKFFIPKNLDYSEALRTVDDEPVRLSFGKMNPYDVGYYRPILKNAFAILTQLFVKDYPNELEQRLKKAITLVSISRRIEYEEVQLTVLCSALEVLVISENKSGTSKISERISFLIEMENKTKQEVQKEIQKIYKIRSDFVRQTKNRQEITDKEISKTLEYIMRIVFKLFSLIDKGYTKLGKNGDYKTSVIEEIDAIKFGQIKSL